MQYYCSSICQRVTGADFEHALVWDWDKVMHSCVLFWLSAILQPHIGLQSRGCHQMLAHLLRESKRDAMMTWRRRRLVTVLVENDILTAL